MPDSGTYVVTEDYYEGNGRLRVTEIECSCPAGAATFEKTIRPQGPMTKPLIGEIVYYFSKAGPTTAPTDNSDLAMYDGWDVGDTLKIISDTVAGEGLNILSGTLNTVRASSILSNKAVTDGVRIALAGNVVNAAKFRVRLVTRVG